MGKASPEAQRKASRAYHHKHRDQELERQRNWYRQNKDARKEKDAAKRNTPKARAGAKVRYAVWAGKLKKPTNCEECGHEKPLHGHHDDYSKPLEVRWLCAMCHGRTHRK